MQVRWSVQAADDLLRIGEYLQRENPGMAERICTLSTFPYRGRIGRVHGTRELPCPLFHS